MDEGKRDRHLHKWASRLDPEDAARFWVVVDRLRLRFAEGDYHSDETYNLSSEFERLQAKGVTARSDGREKLPKQPSAPSQSNTPQAD